MGVRKTPFNLGRFVEAQQAVFDGVVAELRSGQKSSHWMWFVFPQLRGLGRSETARLYAISGLPEARAYLAHPVLGARLRECTALVNAIEGKTAEQIFGSIDALKFRSSMTLFAYAARQEGGVFREALGKFFATADDPLTAARLQSPD